MIEIRELRKTFGPIRAVDRVSLSVEKGEVLGFLGPNGAGKSTTMKMVTGFLRPTGGSASVCGHDVVKDTLKAQRTIGYLPEGAPAYPDMTPESFLKFVAGVRGLQGKARRTAIEQAADLVHLEGVMRQPIETLSKGYTRRVGLAQAILHDPEVLILDEPTDGLDPNQKHEVRNLIRRMAGEKCVVLSTHILEEVEAVCTRAVIIAQGKVVTDGTPAELRSRSRSAGTVTVSVTGNTDGLLDALRGIGGVAEVERLGGNGEALRCAVRPEPTHKDGAMASEVGRVVRDRGLTLGEFTVEPGRLDEVFREITTKEAKA
ncbi:MAG: ATP-binding cassette domain-containing protein [Planctomycetota bacterium]